jgi:hypothetical protein
MDVHKDSITIAILPNDLPKLKRFVDRMAGDGTLCIKCGGGAAASVARSSGSTIVMWQSRCLPGLGQDVVH